MLKFNLLIILIPSIGISVVFITLRCSDLHLFCGSTHKKDDKSKWRSLSTDDKSIFLVKLPKVTNILLIYY